MSNINPSQYFVNFLEEKGIHAVFTVSGGSIHNVLSELDKSRKIKLIPCYNEQGAVYAAEGYARSSGKIGVCLVTSGPGLTNIITGINCCWVDSIPLFILAGQVVESQKMIHLEKITRQRGVQESDTEGLIKSITKSYSTIKDSSDFPKVLHTLWNVASSNRSGPVVLELPVDKSYKLIENIGNFIEPKQDIENISQNKKIEISNFIEYLSEAKTPIFLLGNGIRNCSNTLIKDFINLLQEKGIAYLSTWGSKDLIERLDDNFLYCGSPGIFGNRKANALMHYSDCIVSIGCSLGYSHTGYRVPNINTSSLHIIDIDSAQFCKPEFKNSYKYLIDSQTFMEKIIKIIKNKNLKNLSINKFKNLFDCFKKIDNESASKSKYISLIENINKFLESCTNPNDYVFCTDMGTSFTSTFSHIKYNGARLFTASGHAPMGWGLPGAIGAAIESSKKKIICLSGDGGLLMNLQELMHLSYYNLDLKLIIINNGGYATIMNTTNRYHSRSIASSSTNGIVNPNFHKIAEAYSIPYFKLEDIKDINSYIIQTGPMIIEMNTEPFEYIGPKLMQSSDGLNELINMSPFINSDCIKGAIENCD